MFPTVYPMRDHMPIAVAAARLHTTPRMLRYREQLGLLTAREPGATTHRRYAEDELAAAAYAIDLEQRHDVNPQTLAFGLRALTDPELREDLSRLARATGRQVLDEADPEAP